MRLTLRTLLAYRDRVLNSNELEDMHGRVQQSAMASNLIKRLESLSQRTNILAPPIEGKGLGADANSIAEYLDDSLKGDKVPELERICLESDVQLAELAQCHSLLSAALSTAVDVPDALRDRVLELSDEAARSQALARRHNEAHTNVESHLGTASAKSSGTPSATSQTRDPLDHRGRAGSSSKMRFRTDDGHAGSASDESTNGRANQAQERPLVTAQAVTAPMMASGGDSIRPTGLDLEGSHLAHEVPEYLRGRSRDGWLGPVAIGGLLCLLCLLVWQSIGSWNSVRDMFTLAPSEATQPTDSNGPVPASPNGSPAKPDDPAIAKESTPRSKDPVAAESTAAERAASSNIAGEIVGGATDRSGTPQANDNSATFTQDDATSRLPQVAQWLPVDAVAMRAVILVQAGELPLHRLQASESIPSGCQIFVPSANRPKLDMTRGPQLQFCGLTHALLILPESGSAAEPQVDLRLGRAVVTSGRAGESLMLTTPAGNVRLNLVSGASATIEVHYVPRAHGSVIDRAAYEPTLTIVALEGAPSIELGQKIIELTAVTKLTIQSNSASEPVPGEAPLWIDATFDRPVDLQAAKDLSEKLDGSLAIGEVLQSLATNRRPETRALAAQTLSLLGNWDWVTQAKSSFSEARDRSFWAALLDRTRQILAAHPENVAVLDASLKQLDPQSAQWRRMLWLGLDAGQLQTDSSQKIVVSLDSDALIERILAFQQLQRAFGKDLGYHPGEPDRTIIGQWTRELSSGKLPLLPIPKS